MAKGQIVVSLRSKGLPSFNKALIFDIRYQAVQLATEFLDIFFSALVTFTCLSWTSWISIAINICVIAGSVTTDWGKIGGDFIFVFFMYIVLPLLITYGVVFRRRDQALSAIARFKASFVALLMARPPGITAVQRDASDDLHRRAVVFIEDLHQYLQHRRPYARHFYIPIRPSTPSSNDDLLRVSRELGMLLRRVHRGVRDMHVLVARMREAGFSEQAIASTSVRVESVHAAVEELINIKEMRTPVVVRATVRWFVVVLMPVAFGPFWNTVLNTMGGDAAFAGIFGVLTHVALLGLLDTAVAVEDPFDDSALDAISLFEVLDQVGVMTTPGGADADGYENMGLAGGASPSGGGGGGEGSGERSGGHVAMYVSGSPGRGGGGGGSPEATATSAAGGVSAGAAAASEASSLGPLPSGAPGLMTQPNGVPAMRASVVTSETAVGPPTNRDGYGGGGGGGGGGGQSGAIPSITSPPLPDVTVPLRAPIAMPPMPALAGAPLQQRGPPTAAAPA